MLFSGIVIGFMSMVLFSRMCLRRRSLMVGYFM